MYEFVTGPLAWLSFFVFFCGLFVRLLWYIKGLNWQMDRVTYSVNVMYGVKGAIRSVLCWLLPFGTRAWRFYPGFTFLVFTFHIILLFSPFFLLGHNVLFEERFGFSFWSMPECVSDFMAIVVIVVSVFIIARRIALPEVRILTTLHDYVVMAIAVSPFVTGFFAYNQIGDYGFWIVVHVVSGEIMLIAIPFTKLSHFLLFFVSRVQLGMDYGIKRGGMKNNGMSW